MAIIIIIINNWYFYIRHSMKLEVLAWNKIYHYNQKCRYCKLKFCKIVPQRSFSVAKFQDKTDYILVCFQNGFSLFCVQNLLLSNVKVRNTENVLHPNIVRRSREKEGFNPQLELRLFKFSWCSSENKLSHDGVYIYVMMESDIYHSLVKN